MPDFDWLGPILSLLTGALVGLYGGLVGAGGGFLAVPYLVLLRDFSPERAVGTSLVVVFLTALSGSSWYLRQRRVDVRSAVLLALASVPGSILAAPVVPLIPAKGFRILFGCLLAGFALFLLIRGSPPSQAADEEAVRSQKGRYRSSRRLVDRRGQLFHYELFWPAAVLLGLVIGFLASLLGIGGGLLFVPALIAWLRFPPHVAVATSSFVLFWTSLVALTSHGFLDHVVIGEGLLLGGGALLGAQAGAWISSKLASAWLVRFVGLTLILVGGRMLWPS